MYPHILEVLAPVFALLGLGGAILIGMKMRYNHLRRTRVSGSGQQDVERLADAVDTLRDEVRLLGGPREISGPPVIMCQRGPLFEDEPLELVDAKPGHQKLDPRPRAVFLFAEPGKHPRDGLRERHVGVSRWLTRTERAAHSLQSRRL